MADAEAVAGFCMHLLKPPSKYRDPTQVDLNSGLMLVVDSFNKWCYTRGV